MNYLSIVERQTFQSQVERSMGIREVNGVRSCVIHANNVSISINGTCCLSYCRFLTSQGCIKPLCDLLICPDPRIVTVCLEGLENILKVGEVDKEAGTNGGINMYTHMIDECDGLDKIENLQTHDNNEIYEKAVKILEKYWAEEDEEQNLPDGADGNPQGFQFGNNQPNVPAGGFKFG